MTVRFPRASHVAARARPRPLARRARRHVRTTLSPRVALGASDDRDASAFRRRPFADLSPNDSRLHGRAQARRLAFASGADARERFVETPAALRQRVESLDAFETVVRRTDDSTRLGGELDREEERETEEFDRRRALTPYLGGGKTRFETSVTPETLVTESVEPMGRMGEASGERTGTRRRGRLARRSDGGAPVARRGEIGDSFYDWDDDVIVCEIGAEIHGERGERDGVRDDGVSRACKCVWAVMFPRLSLRFRAQRSRGRGLGAAMGVVFQRMGVETSRCARGTG